MIHLPRLKWFKEVDVFGGAEGVLSQKYQCFKSQCINKDDNHFKQCFKCLSNQTLKMISQVKSFPYPEKQKTLEESLMIQRTKRCVTNNTQNITHEDSSKKLRRISKYLYLILIRGPGSNGNECVLCTSLSS